MINNKISILVSSCLLGVNTKYNGGNNLVNNIKEEMKDFNLIPICPEVDGGLSIPRNPSEIVGDKVVSSTGVDVTNEYQLGAQKAYELAIKYQVKYAILKRKSPSCGNGYIYDGTFSHNLIIGDGITVRKLKELNIKIYDETNYHELLDLLNNLNNNIK